MSIVNQPTKFSIVKADKNIYNQDMFSQVLKSSKEFINYDLNFVIDNMKIKIYNFAIDTFENIDGYDYHKHSCFELHYIKSGHGIVEFKDRQHTLKRGDLFLCAPNSLHKQQVIAGHMIEYSLRFDIELLKLTSNKTSIDESRELTRLLTESSQTLIHEKLDLERLFEQSFLEINDKSPGYYIKIKQYIMDIIIETARSYHARDNQDFIKYDLPVRNIESYRMDIINRYIYDNIASKLTSNNIAVQVFLSERQLYRVIKNNTGMSTHQYIESIRISAVKKMLNQNSLNLSNIAELTGYSSAFHLSASFKKHTGISPKEYINNNREIIIFS